jgi:hypothetical protein
MFPRLGLSVVNVVGGGGQVVHARQCRAISSCGALTIIDFDRPVSVKILQSSCLKCRCEYLATATATAAGAGVVTPIWSGLAAGVQRPLRARARGWQVIRFVVSTVLSPSRLAT